MSTVALLLLFGKIGGPAFAAESPALLNLDDAIQSALQQSPALDSARRSQEISEWAYRNATARLLPSLDATATHGIQDSVPGSGIKPWVSSVGLSLSETLYDNGETWTLRRTTQLDQELSMLQFQKTRDRLVLDVASAFYRYSLRVKLLEVQRQRHDSLSKQHAAVESQYKQGLRTYKDYLRLRTQLQQSEITLFEAENQIEAARTALRRAMGTPSGLAESLLPEFRPLDPDGVRVAVPENRVSLERYYDFRIARLQRQVNELNTDQARRRMWPEVQATAGASYQISNYLGAGIPGVSHPLSWSALLTLKYNLWDWGLRGREVATAESRRQIQSNELEQELIAVRAAQEELMQTLELLRRQYRLSEELLKLSTQSFALLEDEYRRGKLSYLDFTTGLEDLLKARIQFYTSIFSLLESVAEHHFYEGIIYEKLVRSAVAR